VSVAMRRIGSIESHYNRPSGPSPYTMTGAGDVAGECTGDERGARWRWTKSRLRGHGSPRRSPVSRRYAWM